MPHLEIERDSNFQGEIYPNHYLLGLNRMQPADSSQVPSIGSRLYQKGFIESILQDFDYKVSRWEIPDDLTTYEAFLTGLSGEVYPGVSGMPVRTFPTDSPKLDLSYDLGLKLLFLHLGYSEKSIESRRIYARHNPSLLTSYKKEAEKLRDEAV